MAEATLTATRTPLETLRLYWRMTRPGVLFLVLFTGLPALWMGAVVTPSPALAAWVLLGTALAGSACSVLNAWYERDSDARMARTRNRPLPAASVAPGQALGLGIALSVVSTALLYRTGGLVAAGVGLGSIVFYLVVYTIWLKPRTPQNIVIGGAAGATAPLIADAALDGHLGLGGWLLFLIVFVWTPPHFWAIALFRKEDYRAADFPMMPLVVGDQGTRWRMLAYTLLLLPVGVAPTLFGYFGWTYGASAVVLGLWFTWWNVRVLREQDYETDRGMFRASIVYLFALFAAMLVDVVVGALV